MRERPSSLTAIGDGELASYLAWKKDEITLSQARFALEHVGGQVHVVDVLVGAVAAAHGGPNCIDDDGVTHGVSSSRRAPPRRPPLLVPLCLTQRPLTRYRSSLG